MPSEVLAYESVESSIDVGRNIWLYGGGGGGGVETGNISTAVLHFLFLLLPFLPLSNSVFSQSVLLSTHTRIDAFPYYCPGARRGNVFVATWLLRPWPRSTSIVLYASSTVTMSRVLARFSVWSSIFDFF